MSEAGDFRDCVTVLEPSSAGDNQGGADLTFAAAVPSVGFFAKIDRKHFTKAFDNDKFETGIEYIVTIKEEPPSDIMEKRFEIASDSRILKILSMKPTRDFDETEFRCAEVVTSG